MNRLVLAVALGFAISGHGPCDIFRSNEMGMSLEKISPYRTDEFTYYVEIRTDGEDETRILYRDGREIKRWVRNMSESNRMKEVVFIGDRMAAVTYYGPRRNVLRIETYGEDGREEVIEYRYSEGKLQEAIYYGEDNEVIERYRYSRDGAGRLRIFRVVPEQGAEPNEIQNSRYLYSEGNLREEWHGSTEKGDFFRYSRGGQIMLHEEWRDGKLSMRMNNSYDDEGRLRNSTRRHFDEGLIISGTYEEGRLVREVTENDEGSRIEEENYTYTEDGKIKEKVRRSSGLREVWEYFYADDMLKRTVYRKAGRTVKITEYQNEDTYSETIMRNGEALLRIEYQDGLKTGEEQL